MPAASDNQDFFDPILSGSVPVGIRFYPGAENLCGSVNRRAPKATIAVERKKSTCQDFVEFYQKFKARIWP